MEGARDLAKGGKVEDTNVGPLVLPVVLQPAFRQGGTPHEIRATYDASNRREFFAQVHEQATRLANCSFDKSEQKHRLHWQAKALHRNPFILDTLERTAPLGSIRHIESDGDELSNAISRKAIESSALTREKMLQLVYHFLHSNNLRATAASIESETGVQYDGLFSFDKEVLKNLVIMSIYEDHISEAKQSVDCGGKNQLRIAAGSVARTRADSAVYKRFRHFSSDKRAPDGTELGEDCDIYEEGPDVPGANILWMKDDPSKIRAATLNKLVEKVTDGDMNLAKVFLTTYRSFTTPALLFDKILQRYFVPSHYDKVTTMGIKIRCANFVRIWLTTYIDDFDARMFDRLAFFIDALEREKQPKLAGTLRSLLEKQMQNSLKRDRRVMFSEPPPPLKCSLYDLLSCTETSDLFNLDESIFAQQWTLIEHRQFCKIRPQELLNQSWNKPALRHRSPNVLRMIENFNKLSKWTATEIVKPVSMQERAAKFEFFVRLLVQFRSLNNFNSLLSVLSGLNNSAVYRMRRTLQLVSRPLMQQFDEICALMKPEKSYAAYREEIARLELPICPYLGISLSDLTFIEDGNPDYIQVKPAAVVAAATTTTTATPDSIQSPHSTTTTTGGNNQDTVKLINFAKSNLVYHAIRDIAAFQNQQYNLHNIVNIQELILRSIEQYMEHDDLYQLSQEHEPRR